MKDSYSSVESNTQSPPGLTLARTDADFTQLLFNSLRAGVLYLDVWGRIISANTKVTELFGDEEFFGKTVLEFLVGWNKPLDCHQEILKVARTGASVLDNLEEVEINGEKRWFLTDKIAVYEDGSVNGVLMTLDDVTRLKSHEIQIEQSESRYRAFVENSQDSIWCFDIDPPILIDLPEDIITNHIVKQARLSDCNHVFAKVFDKNPKDLIGMTFKEIGLQTFTVEVDDFVQAGFSLNTPEIHWETKDGNNVCLQTSANGTIDNGQLVGIWGVTRDTTERQRYIDRLEFQATHDILTGLPNRGKLQSLVGEIIASAQEGEQFVLMIVDLDSFKEINDTLGHYVGDYIICEIGPRVKQVLSIVNGTIARLGGDEFAIVLPKIRDEKEAIEFAHQIMGCIRSDFFVEDMAIDIRASLGIAIYPDQAKDYSTLMRYADVAMYTAKQATSGVELYAAENDQHSPKRLSLMNALGKAIRENELTLYYQPKIDLRTKDIVGVEALSRWIHPTMGFVSPAEFIPIAEMTDMINEMTNWVLEESLRQTSQWKKQGINIKMAVNISARNLLNDKIIGQIQQLLDRYQLPPDCLELEVTESTAMKNAEQSLEIMRSINDLGVVLSIDDFGTGYSSLAYLKRLPVKWLKIDYSFIINMLENEQDQIIVNSTINLAHNLGMGVVAEGVENLEVQSCLMSMQCEQAQGYYIARPMPAKELEEWIKNYQSK